MGFGQTIVNGTVGTLGNVLGSVLRPSESSAMAAELQATREANAFNAAEAALNRQFQQSSAERSMAMSSEEARLAREFSAIEAEKQRAWEMEMSDTAYQRAVKDLQAAGLNPQLLYTHLNAASTPSGSSAQSFSGHGSSASGSSASGYKADVAAAKKADLSVLDNLVPLLIVSTASSALDSFKNSQFIKTIGSIIDELGTITSKATSAADYLLGGGMKLFGKGYKWAMKQFPSIAKSVSNYRKTH